MNTRALLLALPLVVLAGCKEDNLASVQIQGICVPTDDCTFSNSCDAFYLGVPTLDVASSSLDRLWLILQLENQLTDNSNSNTFRTNTNDAHVDQAVIEYEGLALPRQVLGLNYTIPVNDTNLVSVEVIPDALNASAQLAAYAPTADPRELLAKVVIRGYYDDGTRFETGEFPVSVRICSGCVTATSGLCPGGATAATCPPASNGQLPLSCL